MSAETEPEVRSKPRVRLAFGRLLFRLTAAFSLVVELALWAEAGKWANPPALPRWAIFLFYSPQFLFGAFLVASGCTVLADLVFRLIIRPAVLRWHSPVADSDAASFHLGAFETVVGVTPARRKVWRIWRAGALLRTNQRLWFFPNSSDHEPLCLPNGAWSDPKTVESPPMFLGMVRDLPDYLRLTRDYGVEETFAVPDPSCSVAMLEPPGGIAADRSDARRAS